jgi:putative colanic acid biosynthesis acetyltransferase WcaF
MLWLLIRPVVFGNPIPVPSRIKVAVLRAFGSKIGIGVVIRGGVQISFPWRLSIGEHVWIGDGVQILSLGEVDIQSNCCISQQVYLCTGSHDFSKSTFDLIVEPISIREGSWICARAFIGPGVTVGPSSLVAAGAIVHKDVPPKTMVGGNPAKEIKKFE